MAEFLKKSFCGEVNLKPLFEHWAPVNTKSALEILKCPICLVWSGVHKPVLCWICGMYCLLLQNTYRPLGTMANMFDAGTRKRWWENKRWQCVCCCYRLRHGPKWLWWDGGAIANCQQIGRWWLVTEMAKEQFGNTDASTKKLLEMVRQGENWLIHVNNDYKAKALKVLPPDPDLAHLRKGGPYFDALVSQQVTTWRLDYDGVQIVAVDFDVMSKAGAKHGFNALTRCWWPESEPDKLSLREFCQTHYFVVRYIKMMGVNSLLLSLPWQKMP